MGEVELGGTAAGLRMFPAAAKAAGVQVNGQVALLYSDNSSAKVWCNKRRPGSRISARLIPQIFEHAERLGYGLHINAVAGKDNVAADQLSRRFEWSEDECCDFVADHHDWPRDKVHFLAVPADVEEWFDTLNSETLLLKRWTRAKLPEGAGQFDFRNKAMCVVPPGSEYGPGRRTWNPKNPCSGSCRWHPKTALAAGKEEEDKAMEIRAGEEEINGK
jgi:hypothetical protein